MGQLVRPHQGRLLAGVCRGGLADRFGCSVIPVRILMLAGAVFFGLSLWRSTSAADPDPVGAVTRRPRTPVEWRKPESRGGRIRPPLDQFSSLAVTLVVGTAAAQRAGEVCFWTGRRGNRERPGIFAPGTPLTLSVEAA